MRSVDVIVPLYNKAAYVEQAVRSVLNQTYPVKTIFVADDCSTDNGAEIVRALANEDPRIRLIPSTEDHPTGPSATRNRAFASGDGEFVAMLDADDWWEHDKLALQVSVLEDQDISLVHCLYDLVDHAGSPSRRPLHGLPSWNGRLLDAVRLGEYAVTGSASAVVARRAQMQQAGLFPEHMRFGEDWVLWARLAEFGSFHCVPRPLVHIRWLPATHSRSIDAADRFLANLKVWEIWENDEAYLNLAKPYIRRQLTLAQFHLLKTPKRLQYLLSELSTTRDGLIARSLATGAPTYYLQMVKLLPFVASKLAKKLSRAGVLWRP